MTVCTRGIEMREGEEACGEKERFQERGEVGGKMKRIPMWNSEYKFAAEI